MDTSETYIKMCEKAEEIQTCADDCINEFSVGCWHSPNHVRCEGHFEDWHTEYKYCPICGASLVVIPEYSICRCVPGDDIIWLPRQDQLQAMVISNYTDYYGDSGIHAGLMDECLATIVAMKPKPMFGSMEQIWLAFVMKENHNKVWNGEAWIVGS